MEAGSAVWYRVDEYQWVLAQAASRTTVQLSNGKTRKVGSNDVAPANPNITDGYQDIRKLARVNEPSLLHHVNQRFAKQEYWLTAGLHPISTNPCTIHPEMASAGVQLDCPPQVVELVKDIADDVACTNQPTCILLHGVMGSGKSTLCRDIIQAYSEIKGSPDISVLLTAQHAVLCALTRAGHGAFSNNSQCHVYHKLMLNRFQQISGATAQVCGLDAQRVAGCVGANFNVFYYLIEGLEEEQKAEYYLPGNAQQCRYLECMGGTTSVSRREWAQEQWRDLMGAFQVLGFTQAEQNSIVGILSLILLLGNVKFVVKQTRQVVPVGDASFEGVWKLLDTDPGHLWEYLVHIDSDVVDNDGDFMQVRSNVRLQLLEQRRDQLATSLYSALLQWLFHKSNEAGLAACGDHDGHNQSTYVALLDPAGHTDGDSQAGLKQLMDNYVNDMIDIDVQRVTYDELNEICKSEGVGSQWAWPSQSTAALDVVQLLDGDEGVLQAIQQLSKNGDDSDRQLLSSLAHIARSEVNKNEILAMSSSDSSLFDFRHQFGDVQYSASGMAADNTYPIGGTDVGSLLQQCKQPLIPELQKYMDLDNKSGNNNQVLQLRDQLRGILAHVQRCNVRVVRCIAPNKSLKQGVIDKEHVLKQIRAFNLPQLAAFSKTSFPIVMTHVQFVNRYRLLLQPNLPPLAPGAGPRVGSRACLQILEAHHLNEEQVVFGNNRVMMSPEAYARLQKAYSELNDNVSKIQATWRMYKAVTEYRNRGSVLAPYSDQNTPYGSGQKKSSKIKQSVGQVKSFISQQKGKASSALLGNKSTTQQQIYSAEDSSSQMQLNSQSPGLVNTPSDNQRAVQLESGQSELKTTKSNDRYANDLDYDYQMKQDNNAQLKAAAELHAKEIAELKLRLEQSKAQLSQEQAARSQAEARYDKQKHKEERIWQYFAEKLVQIKGKSADGGVSQRRSEGQIGGRDPQNASPDAAVASQIQSLQVEFDNKVARFEDDLSFLGDAAHGNIEVTPNLNPEQQLTLLKDKFDKWKEKFRHRIKALQTVMKQVSADRQQHTGTSYGLQNGAPSPYDATQYDATQSLTPETSRTRPYQSSSQVDYHQTPPSRGRQSNPTSHRPSNEPQSSSSYQPRSSGRQFGSHRVGDQAKDSPASHAGITQHEVDRYRGRRSGREGWGGERERASSSRRAGGGGYGGSGVREDSGSSRRYDRYDSGAVGGHRSVSVPKR